MDDQFCVGLEDYLGKGLTPVQAVRKQCIPYNNRCFDQVPPLLNRQHSMTRIVSDMPAEKKGTDGGIMVAVGAVVLDETNRVLLVKHVEAKRGGFWFGKWICPGGKLQHGESLEEGTKREVKEETGLEIELTGKPVVFDRIVKRAGKTELHVVYIDHTAHVIRG